MNVDDAEWDDIDHAEDCWPDEEVETPEEEERRRKGGKAGQGRTWCGVARSGVARFHHPT
jgi:hypothetical protein